MATTKIWQIKRTIGKALQYIMNPDKTDERLLVSGFAVEPVLAEFEFDMTAILARNVIGDYSAAGGSNVKAYHMTQSFPKGENITPEQAHELGRQWTNEILGGKHEYVIATHIDKDHIHNHVIFNATSCIDFKKYHTVPKKTVRQLREISDRLCKENGLHVLPPDLPRAGNKGKWQVTESIRTSLKNILEEAIAKSDTYETYLENVQQAGVRIKEGKHLAYLPPKGERFLRGYSIPEDFSCEGVLKKLEHKNMTPEEKDYPTYIENLSQPVTVRDVQELADTLRVIRTEGIQRYSDFADKETILQQQMAELSGHAEALQQKNRQYIQAAKYLTAYKETLPLYTASPQKGGAKEQRKVALHLQARKGLAEMQINPSVDADKVIALVEEQNGQAENITGRVGVLQERTDALLRAEKVVQGVLRQVGRYNEMIIRKDERNNER